jgi:hypothetical protein
MASPRRCLAVPPGRPVLGMGVPINQAVAELIRGIDHRWEI